MAETEKQSQIRKRAMGYVVSFGQRMIVGLGTVYFRWFLIFLALGLLGWLLFANVWQSLNQPVLLPPGVLESNPQVDGDSLQIINSERVQRDQHTLKSFSVFGPLFEPVATLAP